MSEKRQTKPEINEAIEHKIAKYLRAYPEFFNRHLDLLETLHIPHPCRPAISLIERRLMLLRDQNAQLRKKLQELVTVARDNDKLARRMQHLALELISAEGLDELLQGVKSVLRDDFNADFTALRLAARPVETALNEMEEFVSPDGLLLFDSVLRGGRPLGGHLSEERARCLFDNSAPAVGSAVLAPLTGTGWQGVLAVGSRDAERFHPGMGTLFLSRMAELISHALQPYLLPPQAEARS